MCKDEFDREEFLTPKGNRQTYCRPCRAIWFRRYRYLKKYGITVIGVKAPGEPFEYATEATRINADDLLKEMIGQTVRNKPNLLRTH